MLINKAILEKRIGDLLKFSYSMSVPRAPMACPPLHVADAADIRGKALPILDFKSASTITPCKDRPLITSSSEVRSSAHAGEMTWS